MEAVNSSNVKSSWYYNPTFPKSSDVADSLVESERQFQMLPVEVPCEQPTLVFLSFDKPISTSQAEMQMEVHLTKPDSSYSRKSDVKWLNPFSCYFVAKENPPGLVTVHVYEKGTDIGSRVLRYQPKQSELSAKVAELLLRHIRLLCDQLLQMGTPLNDLDHLLASIFDSEDEKNIRECLFTPYRYLNDNVTGFVPGDLELPTILHLSAKYGFSELCCRLTELPDAHYAFRLTNSSGWSPDGIAAQMGHDELAMLLDTFREEEGRKSDAVARHSDQPDYINVEKYLTMGQHGTWKSREDGQSLMDSQGAYDVDEDKADYLSIIEDNDENSAELAEEICDIGNPVHELNQPISSTDEDGASVVTLLTDSDETVLYSPSQVELINLMNQVKNQKLTIVEAEVLFEEWKLRYHKESATFKQKQAKLTRTRRDVPHLWNQIKKGFFKKIVSRLKPTKMETTVISCHSNDSIVQENKCDDCYWEIADEPQYSHVEPSNSQMESPVVHPLLPSYRMPLRIKSPENSDLEERRASDSIMSDNSDLGDDDDSYIFPDQLKDASLSPDFPDPQEKVSVLLEFRSLPQKASLSSGLVDPRQNTSLSADSGIPFPSGSTYWREKFMRKFDEPDYENLVSPPTSKH